MLSFILTNINLLPNNYIYLSKLFLNTILMLLIILNSNNLYFQNCNFFKINKNIVELRIYDYQNM